MCSMQNVIKFSYLCCGLAMIFFGFFNFINIFSFISTDAVMLFGFFFYQM